MSEIPANMPPVDEVEADVVLSKVSLMRALAKLYCRLLRGFLNTTTKKQTNEGKVNM